MGSFTTEFDLFSPLSLKSSFHIAGLSASKVGCTDDEVLLLTRRYLMEQVDFFPGSTSSLHRFLEVSYDTLQQATQQILLFPTPRVLEQSIVEFTIKEVDEELHLQNRIITAIPGMPTQFQLHSATLRSPFF